mgnify:FL=1
MKKALSLILSTASALALSAMPVVAQTASVSGDASCYGICLNSVNSCYYADANKDGICDNCGVGATHGYCYAGYYIDSDGDGVCDNCGVSGKHGYCHGV